MKPGDLVKYAHPANPTIGLVKSSRLHPYLGNLILVQWCNERLTEEEIPDRLLSLEVANEAG